MSCIQLIDINLKTDKLRKHCYSFVTTLFSDHVLFSELGQEALPFMYKLFITKVKTKFLNKCLLYHHQNNKLLTNRSKHSDSKLRKEVSSVLPQEMSHTVVKVPFCSL